jgi:hypothetical protein
MPLHNTPDKTCDKVSIKRLDPELVDALSPFDRPTRQSLLLPRLAPLIQQEISIHLLTDLARLAA